MTAPGKYLEYRENERVARHLDHLPGVREAIRGLYSSNPHGGDFEVLGRILKGKVMVGGRPYTFLLLRHNATKVSLLAVAVGKLSEADLAVFLRQYR